MPPPHGLLQRAPPTRRCGPIIILAAQGDGAAEGRHRHRPLRMTFFARRAGVAGHRPVRLLIALFEPPAANWAQRFAQAPCHRFPVGHPRAGQRVPDQPQEGGGCLARRGGDRWGLEFFLRSAKPSCKPVI